MGVMIPNKVAHFFMAHGVCCCRMVVICQARKPCCL